MEPNLHVSDDLVLSSKATPNREEVPATVERSEHIVIESEVIFWGGDGLRAVVEGMSSVNFVSVMREGGDGRDEFAAILTNLGLLFYKLFSRGQEYPVSLRKSCFGENEGENEGMLLAVSSSCALLEDNNNGDEEDCGGENQFGGGGKRKCRKNKDESSTTALSLALQESGTQTPLLVCRFVSDLERSDYDYQSDIPSPTTHSLLCLT